MNWLTISNTKYAHYLRRGKMKSQKLGKKRIPWWTDTPWKGWWKYYRRRQARNRLKKAGKNEFY